MWRCFSSRAQRPLNFLIVDGYSKDGRDKLMAGGCTLAGILYQRMLARCSEPWVSITTLDPCINQHLIQGAASRIVYPTDADNLDGDLNLMQYDGICWTGSSLTIYEDDPLVKKQIEFAKKLYKTGIPMFGR
jgi:GMP synthase (glutamine-hydrolysing)